jgi:preprotein translocase subunit SecB
MKIALSNSKVLELTLVVDNDTTEGYQNQFAFDFDIKYDDALDNVFYIIFDIKIEHPKDFKLSAKYVSVFKTSEKIDAEFKNSEFTTINAPAIAFPFLRSFVATITLNSGFTPAILPSINFIDFRNQKKIESNFQP